MICFSNMDMSMTDLVVDAAVLSELWTPCQPLQVLHGEVQPLQLKI